MRFSQWVMRVYLLLTVIVLVIYFFLRAITPPWLDIAFMVWCAVFVAVFTRYLRKREAAGIDRQT